MSSRTPAAPSARSARSADEPLRTASRGLLAALCACLAACTLSACGSQGDESPRPDRAAPVRGGALTVLSGTDVDFLDPGRTYYTAGYQVAVATQRSLFTLRPPQASTPQPDLAAGPAHVSADGRTVTVRLRRGVWFSPPVDREVTAQDVAYAMERIYLKNVANPYTQYFQDLVGVPAAPTARLPQVRGISTPDTHTIVFRLRRPAAAAFVAALAMPATAPVPQAYAERFDRQSPSAYNTHVVATGPYMVRNDAAGNTVGYDPGRRIELVRNPSWRRSTDHRPAYLDRIDVRTNRIDRIVAARQVMEGRGMVLAGGAPPSTLRHLRGADASLGTDVQTAGFRYLPINTTIRPFDDLNVRKAILAAFDREGARRLRGGVRTGELATHFLPPGMPGFAEAGGRGGPGLDFLDPRRAGGDLELARQYLRRAGYASGRYEGKETFLMVGPNAQPDSLVAEHARDQLAQLGFRFRLRKLAFDTALGSWCQVPAKKVAICAGLTWASDFPDPAAMLEGAFAGFAINEAGANGNMPQLSVPSIDRAMRRAETLRGAERARAWGQIDRMITAQAPAILLQWDRVTLLRSRDVAGVPNNWMIGWDLAYTGRR